MATRKNVPDYEISDDFWAKIKPLLPLPKPKKKLGMPRKDDKRILSGIFYLLRTGCQWKSLPRFYGAPSTVHYRFQEWQRSGLFDKMWQAGLREYDTKNGLKWEWQAIDGAMTKVPLDGAGTGSNPTDRGKKGTKRSVLDGKGIPLSVIVDGADRHDKKLVKETSDAIIFERPSPDDVIQNICMDKRYDFPDIRQLVKEYGYTAHIKSRGEEKIRIEILGFRVR